MLLAYSIIIITALLYVLLLYYMYSMDYCIIYMYYYM